MSHQTPPVPVDPTLQPSGSLSQTTRGPAGLNEDLRKFSALSPLEQLERLQADGRSIHKRERQMRAAESQARKTAMSICLEQDPTRAAQFRWKAYDAISYDPAPDSPNRHQIGWGRDAAEAVNELLMHATDVELKATQSSEVRS